MPLAELHGPFWTADEKEPHPKAFWTELREHGGRHADFRASAFRHFSERGGYPVVHKRKDVDWTELADLLQETVIRRVIQHDLLNGEGRRRDAALLEALLQRVWLFSVAGREGSLSLQKGMMRAT